MKEIGTIKLEDLNPIEHTINWGEIINSVYNISFNFQNINELNFLYDEYISFMEKYENIENKDLYNETARFNELLYLHSMEMNSEEKLKMTNMLEEGIRENSISFLSDKINMYGDVITPNLKRLNSILKKGFSFQDEKYKEFRSSENIFVGHTKDNDLVHVDYYPPLPEEIDKAMNDILIFLNDPALKTKKPTTYLYDNNDNFNEKYALFIKPLIAHALITILQPFNDGNSRTSRVLNSVDMMRTTNILFEKDYNLPIIYLSRGYFPYGYQYRDLLKSLALEPNNENWNKWLLFGLHNIESYLEYSNTYIDDNNLTQKNI